MEFDEYVLYIKEKNQNHREELKLILERIRIQETIETEDFNKKEILEVYCNQQIHSLRTKNFKCFNEVADLIFLKNRFFSVKILDLIHELIDFLFQNTLEFNYKVYLKESKESIQKLFLIYFIFIYNSTLRTVNRSNEKMVFISYKKFQCFNFDILLGVYSTIENNSLITKPRIFELKEILIYLKFLFQTNSLINSIHDNEFILTYFQNPIKASLFYLRKMSQESNLPIGINKLINHIKENAINYRKNKEMLIKAFLSLKNIFILLEKDFLFFDNILSTEYYNTSKLEILSSILIFFAHINNTLIPRNSIFYNEINLFLNNAIISNYNEYLPYIIQNVFYLLRHFPLRSSNT